MFEQSKDAYEIETSRDHSDDKPPQSAKANSGGVVRSFRCRELRRRRHTSFSHLQIRPERTSKLLGPAIAT